MSDQSKWQIVVADRGWVYVGLVAREGDQVVVREANNIRRWGTTSGLGELALSGPQAETVLDFYGTVRIHVLAVCGGQVECDDAVWDAWLAKSRAPRAKRK